MKDPLNIDQLADVTVALPAQAVPQIEKFTESELANLRSDLLRHQLDSWQAADVTASFLAGHGYGANAASLRAVISGIEMSRCSLASLQNALEAVAYVQ